MFNRKSVPLISPLLFFFWFPSFLRLVNKQDVEGALEEVDMSKQLNLSLLANTYQCPTRIVSQRLFLPSHPGLLDFSSHASKDLRCSLRRTFV